MISVYSVLLITFHENEDADIRLLIYKRMKINRILQQLIEITVISLRYYLQ